MTPELHTQYKPFEANRGMSDLEMQKEALEGLDHKFFEDVLYGVAELRNKV
jgi:hypothetical protein